MIDKHLLSLRDYCNEDLINELEERGFQVKSFDLTPYQQVVRDLEKILDYMWLGNSYEAERLLKSLIWKTTGRIL
jgi:hypothetical protein